MSKVMVVRAMALCARRSAALAFGLGLCLLALSGPAALAQQEEAKPAPAPLTLQDCLRIAFQNSPKVVGARLALVSARAQLTRSKSSYYPQLAMGATQGSTGSGDWSDERSDWQNTANLSLNMTLWQSGRSESVRQSEWQLQASEVSQVDTLQGLVQQVTVDYYKVLAAKQLVGVAEAGYESAQQHLKEVQTLIKYGKTAEVDIYAAEADMARAEVDLINARSGVQSALAGLKFTLGVPYTTELDAAPAEEAPAEALPSLEDAIDLAMRKRPDVQNDRINLETRKLSLRQANIRRGPTLDLGGRFGQPYSDWEAGNHSWSVLASLSWPLLDGGSLRAEVTSAQASLERAQADHVQLVNQVALEIRNALIEIQRTTESLKATEKSLAAAQARLRAAEAKYGRGVGILLEVTDARASLTSAAASLVRGDFDHRVALVALQRAMGVLALPEGVTAGAQRGSP